MSKFDDMMSYQNNRKRFNDLKQNLDSVIPFIGAGLSVPFGFPQWKDFLLNCCIDNSMKENLEKTLNSADSDRYERAASYLKKELSKKNPYYFEQKIRETFDRDIPSCPESAVNLLSSVFKGAILTTNFDLVLEKVTGYKTILMSQSDRFAQFLKQTDTKTILALHGSIEEIEDIILTKEQYDNSYLNNNDFQEKFAQLLNSKILLFLGCSLDQDRTMEFMGRANSLKSTRYVNNYAFMASPAFRFKNIKNKTKEIEEEELAAKEKEAKIEDRLQNVNILPIWYPEGEYQWISEYLSWLSTEQDYLKIFQDLFDTPLFLEHNYEKKIALKNIYVEPDFVFLNEKIPQEHVLTLIYNFMDNCLSDDVKKKRKTINSGHILNTLFILGEPGIGKSSLVSKIIVDRKLSKENTFYCLRLRDLDKSKIKSKGALNTILQMLSIEKTELSQKTLILDGVDELCGIENYKASIDELCFSLIEDAKQLNFKLLFTSRLNYVNLEDIRFDTMLVVKLCPFQEKQFISWFKNYHTIHSETEQTCRLEKDILAFCKTEDEEEKKKLELFGIPLVLYLLAELKLNISDINSIGQLYDKLFEQLEKRFYDDKTTYNIPQLYTNCKKIAEHIAKKMFDTNNDMLTSEEYQEVVLSLPENSKKSLDDMIDKEHFYLLSFYYRITENEKRSVEFIHKSLMEYLVGGLLYCCISGTLSISEEEEQKKRLQEKLDNFFSFCTITDEISTFFLYNAIKNKQQQKLFHLLKKNYKFYLEVGFLYKVDNNINPLNKIQNLFISYWKLLRILANSTKDNLLDEEKNLFCNYLTKFQFKNLDLSSQNLIKCNLNYSFLVQANLKNANLQGVYLQEANLQEANLQGAELKSAQLQGANLQGADLQGMNLKHVNLQKANLEGAHLQGVDLKYIDLEGTHLQGVHLQGVDLKEMDLKGMDLHGAHLQGMHLEGTYLQGANLQGANLQGAHLQGAYLQGADLLGADLLGADLQEADLQGADLQGAHLQGAQLQRANLQGTKLLRTDLQKVYLQEAHLQGAYLQGAYLQEADLQGAHLQGANLQKANLLGVDLQKTHLQEANLLGANLQKAHLQGAKLPLLDLIKAILGKAHLPISLIIKRILIPIIIILCFIGLLFYFLIF